MTRAPFLPDPAKPPYPTREAAEEAYSRHVSAGHVSILNSVLGFHNIHYGKRENERVQDVYSGRWYFDCHRGGSTFNLGHLHPELVRVAQEDVVGVIIEPTPAQSGFPTADPDYLKGVKAACWDGGALFILDEVQTGMGSCGTMWSYEATATRRTSSPRARGWAGACSRFRRRPNRSSRNALNSWRHSHHGLGRRLFPRNVHRAAQPGQLSVQGSSC